MSEQVSYEQLFSLIYSKKEELVKLQKEIETLIKVYAWMKDRQEEKDSWVSVLST